MTDLRGIVTGHNAAGKSVVAVLMDADVAT